MKIDNTVRIVVTGDFCPLNRHENLILENRHDQIFNDFLAHLKNNDLNITNLECPLVSLKSPIAKAGPNIIGTEKSVEALLYGNFNLVTLSNNHIMDQGENGLLSTIRLCKSNNIDYVGAGINSEDASGILIRTIKNKRFAFLNFSENEFSASDTHHAGSNTLDPVKNFYSIKSIREQVDYVIVIIHGGHEGYSLPSPRMVKTYRFFVDAGADIVVGHHPHCYSGYEQYNKGYIFYSLGNFLFDWEGCRNDPWNYGYAVKFYFDENGLSFEIIPYKQGDTHPGIFLLSDSEAAEFTRNLNSLNDTIGNNELLLKAWSNLVKERKHFYLINFEMFNSKIYKVLRYRNLLPCTLSKKKRLELLNMLSCDAHRDLSIESLKQSFKNL
jgi:hypothetical protein